MTADTQMTSAATGKAETPPPSPRRLRALLPRDLYRRVAVQAAREETIANTVVVRALIHYLDEVEKQP